MRPATHYYIQATVPGNVKAMLHKLYHAHWVCSLITTCYMASLNETIHAVISGISSTGDFPIHKHVRSLHFFKVLRQNQEAWLRWPLKWFTWTHIHTHIHITYIFCFLEITCQGYEHSLTLSGYSFTLTGSMHIIVISLFIGLSIWLCS